MLRIRILDIQRLNFMISLCCSDVSLMQVQFHVTVLRRFQSGHRRVIVHATYKYETKHSSKSETLGLCAGLGKTLLCYQYPDAMAA